MPARIWKNPQTQIGADGTTPFIWHETTESLSPNDFTLSRLTNSQSVMVYQTDAYNLHNQPNIDSFLTKVLGGYYGADVTKHIPPLQHPYLKGMFATNILSIRGKGEPILQTVVDQSRLTPTSTFAAYDIVELQVLFQTLPYYVNKTSMHDSTGQTYGINVDANGQPWNPNWFSIESHTEARYTNGSFGFYRFAPGPNPQDNIDYASPVSLLNPIGYVAAQGIYVRRQVQRIHITFHQVPGELVFGGSDLNTSFIHGLQYVGFVNANPMLGWSAGDILLDSIDVLPRGDFIGARRYYDVRAEMIADFNGWNNGINPSNNFQPVVATLGGNGPPFQSYNFATLFSAYNP